MYTSKELEEDLKKIDPRFSIANNPNRPGLSNIFFEGQNYDLHAIPTGEIKEEVDQFYRYEFPSGHSSRHWCKQEIIDQCTDFLKRFGTGEISAEYE